jgi:GGDEF domain-containing protein
MLTKIITFITNNKLTLLIPALLLIVVFLIGSVSKKQKAPWMSLIFTFLAIGGFVVDVLALVPTTFTLLGYPYVFFLSALILLALIVTFIEFLVSVSQFNLRIALIEAMPSNVETNIYGYLNKKGKIVKLTDDFYAIFSELSNRKDDWFETVKNLVCNDEEMTYKKWLAFLKTAPEAVYQVKLELINNQEVLLNLEKKIITAKDKTIGFVLINQKLTLSEVFKDTVHVDYKKRLKVFFDLLDEPVAHFDQEKNKYILSSQMVRILNAKDTELSLQAFEKMIVNEDLSALNKRPTTEGNGKIQYRLLTINGQEWFEESISIVGDQRYLVLHRSDFTKVKMNFKGYPELLSDVNGFIDQNRDFALAFLSLNDLPKIVDLLGNDASELVSLKYFTKLNESSLSGKIKVYRISKMEYGIIIDRMENYDLILRDLKNNVSELLGLEIYFNEKKFALKNSVGIVSSNNVQERTPEAIVKAGFDALFFATDEKYEKRYSIYYPKKTVIETKPEDLKIDLSDQFLDQLLKK